MKIILVRLGKLGTISNFLLEEFGIYLQYVRKLGFEETPDYEFLRNLFTKAIEKNDDVEDDVYDWTLLNNGKGWQVKHDTKYIKILAEKKK